MKRIGKLANSEGFNWHGGATILVAMGLALAAAALHAQPSRTYTLNADFDALNAVKFNVDHAPTTSVNNALEITTVGESFPVLWIANAAEDTVSKIDTATGTEVARYRTWFGPSGQAGFAAHPNNAFAGAAPSRTAVDIDGNAYVLNRHFDGRAAMLTKILNAGGVDRNADTIIQTSTGPADVKNLADNNPGNGQVDVAELQDERIAWVSRVGGNSGLGRALCIGPDGHLWVGLYNSQQFLKVSSVDGSILAGPISVPWTPYGCLIDSDGTLWSASLSNILGKITNTNQPAGQVVTAISHSNACGQNYGIALGASRVNLACISGGGYITCDKATGVCTRPATAPNVAATGISVDGNGDIWLSQYQGGGVFKHRGSDNTSLCSNSAGAGFEHRGVIIDSNNDAWQVGVSGDIIKRFRGSDCAAQNQIAVGDAPYTYSDASGLAVITQTNPTGTWTVIQDAGVNGTSWGTISWNATLPTGATVTVRAQAADDPGTLAGPPANSVTSGASFVATGRYIKVEARLSANPARESPQLLDIKIAALSTVCDIDSDGDVDSADLNLIRAGIGQTPAANDPRDANADGRITINDVRYCTLRCTRASCTQ
jgi:hypothetical protein